MIPGRATESASLHVTAAYLSQVSNSLSKLVGEIFKLLPRVHSEADRDAFRRVLVRVSDAQLTSFVAFDLSASLYKIIYDHQSVAAVADPTLLATYIDPPASFNTFFL